MRLLLLGATGLVGSGTLKLALANPGIAEVVAITRRPLTPQNKLLNPVCERIEELAQSGEPGLWMLSYVHQGRRKPRQEQGKPCAMWIMTSRLCSRRSATKRAQKHALSYLLSGRPPPRCSFYARTKGELERDIQKIGFRCRQGKMTVLRAGTNDWVCIPGDQNIVGWPDMAIDPMGMVWFKDLLARNPKPTNTPKGLIYMLNGATQRRFTDPFDITSPPIPIGPHWMILWPFDARASGLSTVMRDAGTMVMFAGTPYAHLHICESPWEGNEYRRGDRGVWTMRYGRQ